VIPLDIDEIPDEEIELVRFSENELLDSGAGSEE